MFCFGFPRGAPNKEFIEYDSNGEDVTFNRVMVFKEGFRRHVEGSSNVISSLKVELRFDSKSKICNFPICFSLNNVGGFDISMEDILLDEVFISLNNIMNDLNAFVLCKSIPFGEVT